MGPQPDDCTVIRPAVGHVHNLSTRVCYAPDMKRTTLILHFWYDEQGLLQGRLSDPHSDWRHPCHGVEQLQALLAERASLNTFGTGKPNHNESTSQEHNP